MKPPIFATFTTTIGVSRTKKIDELKPVLEMSLDFEGKEIKRFALQSQKKIDIVTPKQTACVVAQYVDIEEKKIGKA